MVYVVFSKKNQGDPGSASIKFFKKNYNIIININININFIHKINLKNFIYTGCPILNNALRFLKNYGRYEKMFQTKVVWFEEGHKKVPLI